MTIDPDPVARDARPPVRRRRSHAAIGSRVFVGGLAISGTVGLAGMMARRPAVAVRVPTRDSAVAFLADPARVGTPSARRVAARARTVSAARQVPIAPPPASSAPAPAPVLSPAPTAPAPVQVPVPAQTAVTAPLPPAPPPVPVTQPPAAAPVVAAPAAAPITTSHASPPPP